MAARMRAMRSRACRRISSRRRGMTLDFSVLSLVMATERAVYNDSLHPPHRAPWSPSHHQSFHCAYGTRRCARPTRALRSTLPRSPRPRARVLLRSIIVEREPIYRQQETVIGFAVGMFGVTADEMHHLGDDRIGRALDRLFDADRAALLPPVVLAVRQAFPLI